MHRILTTSCLILIVALSAQPAAAGEPTAREVERMAVQLERLFEPLAGAVAEQDLVFTRHGKGLYSLQMPLGGAEREAVDVRADADAVLRLLAAGHMLAEPTSPALAINAIVSDPESLYNIWWAVVNQREELESRRTAIKITGPEEFLLEVADRVDYAPSSVQLFWFNPELAFPVGGIYTHRTSVKTGGKNLYKFWVE